MPAHSPARLGQGRWLGSRFRAEGLAAEPRKHRLFFHSAYSVAFLANKTPFIFSSNLRTASIAHKTPMPLRSPNQQFIYLYVVIASITEIAIDDVYGVRSSTIDTSTLVRFKTYRPTSPVIWVHGATSIPIDSICYDQLLLM